MSRLLRPTLPAFLVLALASAITAAAGCAREAPPAPVLAGGSDTPYALASAVLAASTAGDRGRLLAVSLSEAEFRTHVWPHLPAARPERNLPFDYVWTDLRQKSMASLDRMLARMRGERLTLDSITFTGEASQYGTVTVQRDSLMTVRGPDGMVRTIRLFGSMIDQQGTCKVFSYVVD